MIVDVCGAGVGAGVGACIGVGAGVGAVNVGITGAVPVYDGSPII